jgi:negative regulator of flagellin synthesis FlgM
MGKITDIGNINKPIDTKHPVKKKFTKNFNEILDKKMDKTSDTSKNNKTNKVELSNEDKKIIDKAIKETPDVRADKIAEIKAKIANGTYNIDSKLVAEAMLKKGFKP